MKRMTNPFTTHFHVRHYEVNAFGELPNSAFLRLFQETAMRATQDAGFGVEWFDERRAVWVVHRLTLEHLRPVRYPSELAIATWLSEAQRVRVYREYLARDAATGAVVARGRAQWAHLRGDTLFPARIPAEILTRFAPNGIRAVTRLEPRAYPPPATPREFRAARRVQRYETDGLQHVNNAIYVDWVEEVLTEANAGAGALRLWVRRHDLEYERAALPGDELDIVARLAGEGRCVSAWSVEIRRRDELLARDRITALWVDSAGRPVMRSAQLWANRSINSRMNRRPSK